MISHRLTEEERRGILLTCNQPELTALPPGQIVPILVDQDFILIRIEVFVECSMPTARRIALAMQGRLRSSRRCYGWRPED